MTQTSPSNSPDRSSHELALTALVWFKCDLRVRDHVPLAEAMHFESALGLVVIDPQWLERPGAPAAFPFLLDSNSLQPFVPT
jgi:deoxyribodipyrimidine photolyase